MLAGIILFLADRQLPFAYAINSFYKAFCLINISLITFYCIYDSDSSDSKSDKKIGNKKVRLGNIGYSPQMKDR